MPLRINGTMELSRCYLEIQDDVVKYHEGSVVGTTHTFTYREINAVLRGTDSVLSFQIGRQTFKIPIKPDNAEHRTAVARLVSNCRRTLPATA